MELECNTFDGAISLFAVHIHEIGSSDARRIANMLR